MCDGQRFQASPGLAALDPSTLMEDPALFSEGHKGGRARGQSSVTNTSHLLGS